MIVGLESLPGVHSTVAGRSDARLPKVHKCHNNRGMPQFMTNDALLNDVIDFTPNEGFQAQPEEPDALVNSVLSAGSSGQSATDLPAHLQRLCSTDLLSHEEEAALFREMNYLKYRASLLQSELKASAPNPEDLQALRNLLQAAVKIRDHLVKANARLVISVVKKFVTPLNSFDEILSDGLLTLMHAVEKFDYDRGFRFSTYAYRSIARDAYRAVKTTSKEEARLTRDAEEWAFSDSEGVSGESQDELWSSLSELTSNMVQRLDRRERFIIRSRYALGAHRKKRSFQDLADKLGVSKERARQLEQRAMKKLREMAAEIDLDELSGVLS